MAIIKASFRILVGVLFGVGSAIALTPAFAAFTTDQGVIKWQDSVFRDDEAGAYEQVAMEIRDAPDTGTPYSNWSREYPKWRTHEMSDHLPVWIELRTDYSDEYLDTTANLVPSET